MPTQLTLMAQFTDQLCVSATNDRISQWTGLSGQRVDRMDINFPKFHAARDSQGLSCVSRST